MHDKYQVIYADPAWKHYGSETKDQAAGKHYSCMSAEELAALNVRERWAEKNAVLFMWATCPLLDVAIATLKAWDFHYRGVAFIWVKTNQAGKIISGQGVRPTHVKPTTELVLFGSTQKVGRALPLMTEAMGQVVLAPRPQNVHSRKPPEVRRRIEELLGPDVSKIELFARERFPNWDAWGNELSEETS
jgi:site-specific DNA-methyltransferase (adenine-specific)